MVSLFRGHSFIYGLLSVDSLGSVSKSINCLLDNPFNGLCLNLSKNDFFITGVVVFATDSLVVISLVAAFGAFKISYLQKKIFIL